MLPPVEPRPANAPLGPRETSTCSMLKTSREVTPASRSRATALSIFQHLKGRLAPFKRIRRLEFAELPKTISGKIRRVELRRDEEKRAAENRRGPGEFREEDFPELAKG